MPAELRLSASLDVMKQLAKDAMTVVVKSGLSGGVLADPRHERTKAFLSKVL